MRNRRLAGLLVGCVVLAGCGGEPERREDGARPAAPTDGRCTAVDPDARLRQLRQAKAELATPPGKGAGIPGNVGDYAYVSAPLDIAGAGRYAFRFGPMPATFDYPKSPTSLSFDTPADFHGRVSLDLQRDPAFVEHDGARYLEAYAEVSGDIGACTALVIFLY